MTLSKKDLRKKSKLIRAALESEGRIAEISRCITRKIRALKDFKDAKNVMLFYPKEGEINLLGLLSCPESKDKNFYLPRCLKGKCTQGESFEPLMSICKYREGDELLTNEYNIPEPVCEVLEDVSILDIIFVPALCADKYCHRIGYGAGYYDNFFKRHKNLRAKKIIVLPLEMYTDKIDADEHDIACDMVISED